MKKLLVIIFLIVSCLAFGTDWYVDNAASGGNDGTSWTDAWESLATIIWGGAGVVANDTLYISGGSTTKTYEEALAIEAEGTSGNPITIKVGQDANHDGIAIIDTIDHEKYVHLDGQRPVGTIGIRTMYIGAGSGDSIGHKTLYVEVTDPTLTDRKGMNFVGADGIEIAYCNIHGVINDAIGLGGSVGTFGNNLIHDNIINGTKDDGVICDSGCDIYDNWMYGGYEGVDIGHPDGVQALGSYNRIYNNKFIDFYNCGIFLDFLSDTTYVYAYNNVVVETFDSSRGIELKAEVGCDAISNVIIANNTIVDAYRWGIYLKKNDTASLEDSYFVNNMIYNCGRDGSNAFLHEAFESESGIVLDYNQVHAGLSGNALAPDTANDVTAEPVFVSYAEMGGDSNNLHIVSADPAVDAGCDMSAFFTTDKDGVSRPCGIAWDIGAYEYGGDKLVMVLAGILLAVGSTGLFAAGIFLLEKAA